MRLAHSQTTPWTRPPAVRGGTIEFKILLEGQEGTPTNYQMRLANTDVNFRFPRHHHNFDQVRFALIGSTNIGPKRNLEEGDLAYFPEGTYYGPQNQEEGGKDSLSMVIQFGGPSGNGYMSKRQMNDTFDKLASEGRFEGGVYRRNSPAPDGRVNQDAYEAIWEHQNGRPVAYSMPRFMDAVHLREQNFEWQPMPGKTGVAAKHIGTFTERSVGVHFVRLDAGATSTLPTAPQTQIVFIKNGTGVLDTGDPWSQHTAMDLAAGESAEMRATTLTEAMVLLLPRF